MSEAKPLNDVVDVVDVDVVGVAAVVESAVDRVATKAEEIHRAVGNAPITLLERLGLLASSADDLREVHQDAIGVVYDLVREINHSVHDLGQELRQSLEERDSAEA